MADPDVMLIHGLACSGGDLAPLCRIVPGATSPVRRKELDKMAMTDAQVLVAQGRRLGKLEGLQEGRQEGRQEGYAAILVRQLERRFGPLTDDQRSAVGRLHDTEAVDMSLRLLDAHSLADVGL